MCSGAGYSERYRHRRGWKFAFGHGLSYTEFTYGEAKAAKASMKGKFTAYIGSASDDIRTQIEFDVI